MFGFWSKISGHATSVKDITNSTVTISHGGITDATLQTILGTYEKNIKMLEEKLSHALPLEEKIALDSQLQRAKEELKRKHEEIALHQKTINDIQPNEKILRKAKELLDHSGIDAAIRYLQSPEATKKQHRVDALMIEQAKKFQFEAQLLTTRDRYDDAALAYEQMLRYDRSHERLFEAAYFLQKQNAFQKAARYYEEALTLRRALAKTDPGAYTPDVAMTLNNLAILYSDDNRLKAAERAYDEALTLYRALAKTNPGAYSIDLAKTLIIGAVWLKKPHSDLEEAQKILEGYADLHEARQLLESIETVTKK